MVKTTTTKTIIIIQLHLLRHLSKITLKKDIEDKEKGHLVACPLINKSFPLM